MACMYVDGLLLLQTILYFTIVATGLATAISSSLAKKDFGGQCILYGKAMCANSTDGFSCDKVEYGRDSVCSFIVAGNVFACVLYAFANGCYHAYAVHRSRVIIRVASQMWLRSLLLGSALAFVVTLVAACTVTAGLTTWCGNLQLYNASHSSTTITTTTTTTTTTTAATSTTPVATTTAFLASTSQQSPPKSPLQNQGNGTGTGTRLRRSVESPAISNHSFLEEFTCADTQAKIWTIDGKKYGPNEYYYSFSVAESSCWVNVAIWLLQIIFYTRRMVKSCRQRQQNTYQDPFTVDDAFDVFN